MAAGQLGVYWTPAGVNIPDIGTKALVDVTDGDTPVIQMPIRMLSVDTPEVTARSEQGAAKVDQKFSELARWIAEGRAPVSDRFAAYITPKLATGTAGSLHFSSGRQASAWFKAEVERRLTKPNGTRRRLFVRVSKEPFDNYGRLLAYLAPNFEPRELSALSRAERATFNLGLVGSGWAAPFVVYPNIPGELDLPLFVATGAEAVVERRGQWAEPLALPGYEYRMCEKLHQVTAKIVGGAEVRGADRLSWRSRYCADMRTRALHGPEDYMDVPESHRLWIWPQDVQDAYGKLNLVPSEGLVRGRGAPRSPSPGREGTWSR